MADSKPASSKPRKRSSPGSSNGSAPKTKSKPTARSKASTSRASTSKAATSKAASRSKPASRSKSGSKSASSSKPAAAAQQNGSTSVTDRVGQVAGTAKQAAGKAKGPAVAVGAAAAGIAGGLLVKSRMSRPKVLGLSVPRSLKKPSLDPKSIAKTVGDASQTFAKTSKSVSKDLERAGDQAERIGKILGR